jgi:transcriptional regulator with XRE-family HTH domain
MPRDQSLLSPHDPTRESTVRLGQRLRRARLTHNLTQGELAKNLFSVSYISGVERGQIRPSLGALDKLAERLQVPVTELLANSDSDMRHAHSPVQHHEGHREEVESSLREAQILARQHNNEWAITILLRLQTQQLTPREMAMVQLSLAASYSQEERAEEARRVAQDAIPVAERAGERELAERLRLELGHAFALMQSHATALEQYQKCLQAVQEQTIQDPAFHLSALLNIGTQYLSMADYEQAIAAFMQAVDVAEEVMWPEALG